MHGPIGVKAAIGEARGTLDQACSLVALLQMKSPEKKSSENR